MCVKGRSQQLEVLFGPKYNTAVVYSPQPRAAAPGRGGGASPSASPNFVCFEPMAGITDAMNLAQRGIYRDLQMLAPGQTWRESFWIRPSGF